MAAALDEHKVDICEPCGYRDEVSPRFRPLLDKVAVRRDDGNARGARLLEAPAVLAPLVDIVAVAIALDNADADARARSSGSTRSMNVVLPVFETGAEIVTSGRLRRSLAMRPQARCQSATVLTLKNSAASGKST